ncbi:hypothetical protein LINGRAHAP2_LOCUS20315 [Linum grandiflorum]
MSSLKYSFLILLFPWSIQGSSTKAAHNNQSLEKVVTNYHDGEFRYIWEPLVATHNPSEKHYKHSSLGDGVSPVS